ncbi:MAG: beta-N-acetylhexosaminidase, partial [Sphaerochaeta sp.]
SSVVVGTYNGHLHTGQLALANRLAQKLPTLCVALRNPYDLGLLDKRVRSIAAYAYTESVIHALSQVLLGKAEMTGVLPVVLPEQGEA